MWMVGSAVQQGKARHVGRNKKMKHMERDGELEKMGGRLPEIEREGKLAKSGLSTYHTKV